MKLSLLNTRNFFDPAHIYFRNIYIAPLQGNLLRGDLCTGLYDVKYHYEQKFPINN